MLSLHGQAVCVPDYAVLIYPPEISEGPKPIDPNVEHLARISLANAIARAKQREEEEA